MSVATWIAVAIMFLISGLGLRTYIFVQVYSFGFVSAFVFGISKGLLAANVLGEALTAGMIICSCLPMAVNSTIVLTAVADGNEAAAIFHSAFGNMVGKFLSPLLIVA
jgi:sodium/bile acid cotransporter 7